MPASPDGTIISSMVILGVCASAAGAKIIAMAASSADDRRILLSPFCPHADRSGVRFRLRREDHTSAMSKSRKALQPAGWAKHRARERASGVCPPLVQYCSGWWARREDAPL